MIQQNIHIENFFWVKVLGEIHMRALVTGGCGFIGSHIIDLLLAEGLEVVVVDNFSTGRRENLQHHKNNPRLKIVVANLADTNEDIAPYLQGIDYVFHLAALADIVPSIENPVAYHCANVNGTINLLTAIQRAQSQCASTQIKRFVYAASSSCYGLAKSFPTNENHPIIPEYPYALTKYLAEEYVLHWGKVYKLPVVSLRLFNVYGPRSRTSGTYGAVFGIFLKQKLANKPFTVVGNGEQTRDFTYVTDVARAFWMAATASATKVCNQVMNVGSGGTYKVNYLAQLLGGEKVFIPKRPGEPDCTFADTTKIRQLLGWAPLNSFEQGVAQVVERIEDWKEAPLWDQHSIEQATKSWFKYLSNDNSKDAGAVKDGV